MKTLLAAESNTAGRLGWMTESRTEKWSRPASPWSERTAILVRERLCTPTLNCFLCHCDLTICPVSSPNCLLPLCTVDNHKFTGELRPSRDFGQGGYGIIKAVYSEVKISGIACTDSFVKLLGSYLKRAPKTLCADILYNK